MKKIFFKAVLVLSVLIVQTGCSNWKQDPLADQDGILGNGTDKPVKEETEKPLSSDAVRIVSDDFLRFKENEELSFTIGVKNLLAGYSAELNIDNMAEFPGAKFNSSKGIFTWRPSKGTILAKDVERYMVLKVRAIASRQGSATIYNEKEIQVVLNRQFNKPQITNIARSATLLREGEQAEVRVMIDDLDADPMDVNTWSRVMILPTQFQQKIISGYMSLKSYRFVSGTTYEAIFTINLTDAEISQSKDDFYFDVALNSRFNQASDRQTQSVTVYTSFTELKSTWTTILEAQLGTKINYQFLIYDPKGELTVSFSGLKNQIKGSTVKCIKATTSTLSCVFALDTTTMVDPAVLSFSVVTNSKSQYSGDTQEIAKDHNLTVNLVK
jgi:hypothetical protein